MNRVAERAAPVFVSIAMMLMASTAIASPLSQDTVQEEPPKEEKPALYDEQADAKEQIATALARAKCENRRVLIQWGANWCHWCHLLQNACTSNADLARKLQFEYEVVHVDIGRGEKNADLAQKYGAKYKVDGVPYFTVLSADGEVVANHDTGSLEAEIDGKPGHDVEKILAFLTEHQMPELNAAREMRAACEKAKRENKLVFVRFGSPTSSECNRFDEWFADNDITGLAATDCVTLKIDVDRMKGGQALLQRLNRGKSRSLPWYACMKPDGDIVRDSVIGNRNLGCPKTEEDVQQLTSMMSQCFRSCDREALKKICLSLCEVKRMRNLQPGPSK